MSRTAIYRGQRFNVVAENAKTVTLEGFGYKRNVQLEEVIFENEPETDVLMAAPEVKELPSAVTPEELPAKHPEDHDIVSLDDLAEKMEHEENVDVVKIKNELMNLKEMGLDFVDLTNKKIINHIIIPKAPELNKFLSSNVTFENHIEFQKLHDEVSTIVSEVFGQELNNSIQTVDYLINSVNHQLAETLKNLVVPPVIDTAVTPAPDVSNKVYPDYPKFGLNLSVDTSADRHAENEKRRQQYVSDMKMKLKEMMTKLDEIDNMDHDVVSQFHEESDKKVVRISYDIVSPESAENGDFEESGWEDEDGVDMTPDAEDAANNVTAVTKTIDLLKKNGAIHPSTMPNFSKGTWYSDEAEQDPQTGNYKTFNFHLDGFSPEEEKEIFTAVTKKLEEDGAAPASAGGGTPSAAGVVDVASTTGPGVSTANVANFNARMNIGLTHKKREEEKFKNVKE